MKFIFFTLITAGFFYQTVIFHKLPVPTDTLIGLYHPWRDLYAEKYPRGVPFKNFLITDPIRQQIPWRKIVMDSWKTGTIPSYNPYTFAGVPLDSNVQAAPFYPFNVLFFLFDFAFAWTILILLQPLLAMSFLYVYLSRIGISKWAAIVGALSWGFGGFSIAWLAWGTIMQTALWLPLMLLFIEKNKPFLLGFAMIMTIVAGHMQIALYTMLAAIAYLFWRNKFSKKYVFVFVVVGAITSIQWIPFMRSVMESGRVDSEAWKLAGWFLPWKHLIQFAIPDFFGNPATLNYWGEWNYGEFIGYIGIIPIILAMSAVGIRGTTGFYMVVAGLSLLCMLPNPLSFLFYKLRVPFLSVMQPTRLMVLVDFSLAVLASIGLDHLLKGNKKSIQKSILLFGLLFVFLWLFVLGAKIEHIDVVKRNLVLPSVLFVFFLIWLRMRKIAGVAILILVVAFDLFRFGWKFTPFTPKEYFFPTTKVITFLQNQPKPFRVMSLDDRIFPPNVSSYYGIETIEGYDPIAPRLYENFLGASERGKAEEDQQVGFNRIYTAHNIDSPLLPYMNVRFVLALDDIARPFLREIMREGETRVYEYTGVLPRVYLANTVLPIAKQSQELSELFTRQESFLGMYSTPIDLSNSPLSSEESVTITEYLPGRIRLSVRVAIPRLLVVLNRYDRRWSARTKEDEQLTIFPLNYLFMGLTVPVGTHDIILTYY